MARRRPDVMILDRAARYGRHPGDPRRQGWASTPIIVLSVWGHESQRSAASRRGRGRRDQTVRHGRPLARLRAAIRRASPPPDEPVAKTGDFTVGLAAKRVTRADGSAVRLTPTEWQLLEILVRNRGRLVTQRQLLQEAADVAPEQMFCAHALTYAYYFSPKFPLSTGL
jgi:two-component system KDP operon response regulator KdpE